MAAMRRITSLILLLLFAWPVAVHAEERAGWTRDDIDALLAVAAGTAVEGINRDRYPVPALEAALRAGDTEAMEAAASVLFRQIALDFHNGAADSAARLRWRVTRPPAEDLDPDALMANALERHAVAQSLLGLLPSHPQYLALKSALANARPGDSKAIDRLRANLERWRWMPRSLGRSHVVVNVPSGELVYVRDGVERDRRRIIYGARKTPTYQFSAEISGVAFNPTWYVPRSIAIGEGLEDLLRERPAAAAQLGYYRGEDGGIRQKPGPKNPLGQMKLIMPNPFSVFVHDTPARNLFAQETRAYSHGCIRVEGALEFAQSLLGPSWSADAIAEVVATGSTVTVDLDEPVPVYVAYFTAQASDDGQISFFRDIYGLDAILLRGLRQRAPGVSASQEEPGECAG